MDRFICPECKCAFSFEEMQSQQCGNCGYPDTDDFDEDNEECEDFECCDDCDLPDACADFGCAISMRIKNMPIRF